MNIQEIIKGRCEREGYAFEPDYVMEVIENIEDDDWQDEANVRGESIDDFLFAEYRYMAMHDAFVDYIRTTQHDGRYMSPDIEGNILKFSVYKDNVVPYTTYGGDIYETWLVDFVDDHGTFAFANLRKGA